MGKVAAKDKEPKDPLAPKVKDLKEKKKSTSKLAKTAYRKKCTLRYPDKVPCPIHPAFGLPGSRTLRTWYVKVDQQTKTMNRLSNEELQHNMECPAMISYRQSIRDPTKENLRCAGCDELFAYEHSIASHQICSDAHFICPTCPGVERRTLALLQDHFKQANHKLRAMGWTLDGNLLTWDDVKCAKDPATPPEGAPSIPRQSAGPPLPTNTHPLMGTWAYQPALALSGTMPTSHRAGPVVPFPIPANLVANSMQALQNAGINPYDAQAWQAAVLAQTAALAQASENGDPSGGLDYLLEAVLQQQPGLAMPRGDPGEEIEVVDMGLVAEDMNQQAGFPGEPEKDSPDSPPPDNDGEEVLAHDELKDEDDGDP